MRWDIFCRVIDNFGDIGVCWRLARQLGFEHGAGVRLVVDDLDSFARLCPEIDVAAHSQTIGGVEIVRWDDALQLDPGEVVVEAFGCALPSPYIASMAMLRVPPVWINLEYLSAESWVQGCHGMASPHPQYPLVKYFFFPGVAAGTGGVLRERDLLERRRAFDAGRFWDSLGRKCPAPDVVKVSLFAYANQGLEELLTVMATGDQEICCVVPEGRLLEPLARILKTADLQPGDEILNGRLALRVIPFLPQPRYDELLWACDVNFVRGEDSFVRAQWAGRAFVWQIYPQPDDAHHQKLEAFRQRYSAGMPPAAAAGLAAMWDAWNGWGLVSAAWPEFLSQRQTIDLHAGQWVHSLENLGDLTTNLVRFCEKRLKSQV